MSNLALIQLPVELTIAVFALLCAVITFISRKDELNRSRYLIRMLLFSIGTVVSDSLTILLHAAQKPIPYFILRCAYTAIYFIYPMMFITVIRYLYLLIASHGFKPNRLWVRIMDSICGFHILGVVVSLFSGLFFYFDENHLYHRSEFYPVLALFGAAELIYIMVLLIGYWRCLSRYEAIALLFFVTLPFGTNLFQIYDYRISLTEMTSCICSILFFMFHQVEKSARITGQQEELARQKEVLLEHKLLLAEKENALNAARIQLSISQMQPHFVFNALGSIEQLCKINPKKAAEATHQFALYLRRNLIAISSGELRSFQEELDHINAYVWLEKMRFGDDISYEEEIQTSDFQLPMLSVQPLVENAIKHGMMGAEEGTLHVRLKTSETEDFYLIQVSDDGCGFDPDYIPDTSRMHVGLSNVRTRIEQMCHGRLEVHSTIGQGSCFTIYLPKANM